jgi:hypothetical protein
MTRRGPSPQALVSVDATPVRGTIRAVSTHLPVVLVADAGGGPATATYADLQPAGSAAARTASNPQDRHGCTCRHAMPLDDPHDRLRRRIESLLTRGGMAIADALVVGAESAGVAPAGSAEV